MIWVNGEAEKEADKDASFMLTLVKYFGENFTRETFLATGYTTQKSVGNILHVSVDERRKTTDQIFGLTAFQEPFQRISDYAKKTQEDLDSLRLTVNRIGNITSIKSDMTEKKAKLQIFNSDLADIRLKIEELEKEITNKKNALVSLSSENTDTSALVENKAKLEADIAAKKKEISLLISRKENLSGIDGRLASVEKAKLVVPELKNSRERKEKELDDAAVEFSEYETRRKDDLKSIEAELTELSTEETKLFTEYQAKTKAKAELESKIARSKSAKEARDKSAALLQDVGCAKPEYEEAANSCKLLADARTAKKDSLDLLELLLKLESEVTQISIDDTSLSEVRIKKTETTRKRDLLLSDSVYTAMNRNIQNIKNELAEIVRNIAQGEDILAKESELLLSKNMLVDIEKSLLDVAADVTRLETELSVVTAQLSGFQESAIALETTKKEISKAELELQGKKQIVEALIKNISTAEVELTIAENKILELADMLRKEESLLEEIELANELKQAYSPTGARALIVDAMSPQLSETINELLREYYGDEFLIEFRTVKTLQNGNQEECYDIMVHDKKPGVPVSTANNKSPGQQGILTEVVGLGVLIEAYRRSGLALKTIIRDEATAAMDSNNAEKYLSMLLRAKELTNIDSILYITHNPILAMRADAYLCVENGEIIVRKEIGIRE
jgi:DNA repair exonuclease SbcCD ATPase subunit